MVRVRQWGLLTALGVVGVCLWVLTRPRPALLPAVVSTLGWGAAVVVVASAGVVLAVEVAARAAGARRRRRGRVLEQLHEAVARAGGEGGHTVSVRGWSKTVPERVVVTFPRHARPEPAVVGRVAREVGVVVGAAGGPRRWQARWRPLRPVLVLTPCPRSEAEDRREAVTDRVVALVKKTVPGARSVRVSEWTDAGEPAAIVTTYEPSPRLSSATVEAAVLRVVGDTLPGRWRAVWDRENDRVRFELKPGLPTVVDRPAGLGVPESLRLRYGVDADGRVHAWDLGGVAPHALVVGPTGGGKTFALRAMALDAISQGMLVYGADPKMIELVGLSGLPGVGRVATEPEDIADLLVAVDAMMTSRYRDLQALRVRREQLRPVLLILDEFFILKMRLNRAWAEAGEKGQHPALALVPQLLALARSARIHLCLGIQRPDAEFFAGGAARDNLRHRVSLSQLSPNGAEMVWEDRSVGTDLPAIPGRALATGPAGGPVEVQVYRVPDPDLRLRRERSAAERAVLEEIFATAVDATAPEQLAPAEPGPDAAQPVADGVGSGGDGPDRRPPAPAPPAEELDRALLGTEGGPPTGEAEGDVPPASSTTAWVSAQAESLVAGDVVRLDGRSVALTDVEADPLDEDYVVLSWPEGALAVSTREMVDRAA